MNLQAKTLRYLLVLPIIMVVTIPLLLRWRSGYLSVAPKNRSMEIEEIRARHAPVVTVDVTGRSVVLVTGEVLKPGVHEVGDPGTVTVAELIELAGLSDFADLDQIEVHRRGGEELFLSYGDTTNFDAASFVLIKVNKKTAFPRKTKY